MRERIRKKEDFLTRASLDHVLSCTFWLPRNTSEGFDFF